jgi:hypothetical protein
LAGVLDADDDIARTSIIPLETVRGAFGDDLGNPARPDIEPYPFTSGREDSRRSHARQLGADVTIVGRSCRSTGTIPYLTANAAASRRECTRSFEQMFCTCVRMVFGLT